MNKLELHQHITDILEATYKDKNADYGDSFGKLYEKFGLKSSIIRLYDKLHRLETLIDNEQQVQDESIKDTLRDLANYSIMTLIEMRKEEEKKIKPAEPPEDSYDYDQPYTSRRQQDGS